MWHIRITYSLSKANRIRHYLFLNKEKRKKQPISTHAKEEAISQKIAESYFVKIVT